MQVTLCLMIAFIAYSNGLSGISAYNKFGIFTKNIYTDRQNQNDDYNVGLPNSIQKSVLINKEYLNSPEKQNFAYNSDYDVQQFQQPIENRIILRSVPVENPITKAPLVRVIYAGVDNAQPKAYTILNDNLNIATSSKYIPQNIGNIVQSGNLFQQDIYKSSTDYTPNLGNRYFQTNEPEFLRVVRSAVDDRSSNGYPAGDGIIYRVLPEEICQTPFPGVNLDSSSNQFQILKNVDATPIFGNDNQLQVIDQNIQLNNGQLFVQKLDGNIPQSELLKLFSR